jgi:hypothetical protein
LVVVLGSHLLRQAVISVLKEAKSQAPQVVIEQEMGVIKFSGEAKLVRDRVDLPVVRDGVDIKAARRGEVGIKVVKVVETKDIRGRALTALAGRVDDKL